MSNYPTDLYTFILNNNFSIQRRYTNINGSLYPVTQTQKIIKSHLYQTSINPNKYSNIEETKCNICFDDVKCIDTVELNCKHTLCQICFTNILNMKTETNNLCAFCRAPIETLCVFNTNTYNLVKNK